MREPRRKACFASGSGMPAASEHASVAVDELVAAFIMRGGGAAWALGRKHGLKCQKKISEHVTARFEGQRTVGWLSIQRRPVRWRPAPCRARCSSARRTQ